MKFKVFYSWQSDLPNSKNRRLILDSLENAIKEIVEEDFTLEVSLDRDTVGIPGSPDIADSVFRKIDSCNIFVGDISIINQKEVASRKCSNPNVLIETGFAASSLNWNKIIMVFNAEFGSIEQLPFDLRARRVLVYDSSKDDRGKNFLKSAFKTAIKAIIVEFKQRNIVLSGRGMANEGHNYTSEECQAIIDGLPKSKLLKQGEFVVNEIADGFTKDMNNPYVFVATPQRLGDATIGAGGFDGGWRKIGSSIVSNRKDLEGIVMDLYCSDNALHANFPIHAKFYGLDI